MLTFAYPGSLLQPQYKDPNSGHPLSTVLTASLVYQEWPVPLRTTLLHSTAHYTSAGLFLRTFVVLAPTCRQTLQETLFASIFISLYIPVPYLEYVSYLFPLWIF